MTTLREPLREEKASVPPSRPRRKFRPELQGLRALAAALVVVYHVWLDRISGGVDARVCVVVSSSARSGAGCSNACSPPR